MKRAHKKQNQRCELDLYAKQNMDSSKVYQQSNICTNKTSPGAQQSSNYTKIKTSDIHNFPA